MTKFFAFCFIGMVVFAFSCQPSPEITFDGVSESIVMTPVDEEEEFLYNLDRSMESLDKELQTIQADLKELHEEKTNI